MPKKQTITIKFCLLLSKKASDGKCPVYLITQYRGRGQYSTGIRMSEKEWNNGNPRDKGVQVRLGKLRSVLEEHILRLELDGVQYSASSVLDVLKKGIVSVPSYKSVMEGLLQKRQSSPKTVMNHLYVYNVLCKFMGRGSFFVYEVDESLLRRWIRSVEGDWKPLSIKSVLSRICDVWNTYINDYKGDSSSYPFHSIKISSFKKVSSPKVLNGVQVEGLFSYYLESYIYNKVYGFEDGLMNRNSECFALGCFLLSYSFFGLALVDLLKLKVDCIEECSEGWRFNGVVRSKTRTPVPLFLVHSPFVDAVIPHLLSSAHLRDGYLLPGIQNNSMSLLSDTPERITYQVSNCTRIVNANLKGVWRKVGIPQDTTFYSCRTSAASIYLSKEGANIFVLAHLMGRSVEGISTYVANIKSGEELMKERMKLIL